MCSNGSKYLHSSTYIIRSQSKDVDISLKAQVHVHVGAWTFCVRRATNSEVAAVQSGFDLPDRVRPDWLGKASAAFARKKGQCIQPKGMVTHIIAQHV